MNFSHFAILLSACAICACGVEVGDPNVDQARLEKEDPGIGKQFYQQWGPFTANNYNCNYKQFFVPAGTTVYVWDGSGSGDAVMYLYNPAGNSSPCYNAPGMTDYCTGAGYPSPGVWTAYLCGNSSYANVYMYAQY